MPGNEIGRSRPRSLPRTGEGAIRGYGFELWPLPFEELPLPSPGGGGAVAEPVESVESVLALLFGCLDPLSSLVLVGG